MTQNANGQRGISPEEKRVLEFISSYMWEQEKWPSFWEVDRPLLREGIDAQKVLSKLIPECVHIDGNPQSIQSEEVLRLTMAGIVHTPQASIAVDLFLATLSRLVRFEEEYEPEPGNIEARYASTDLVSSLSPFRGPQVGEQLATRIGLLLLEESGNLRFGSSRNGPKVWFIYLTSQIRLFKSVKTMDEYFEIIERSGSRVDFTQTDSQSTASADIAAAVPAELVEVDVTGESLNRRSVFIVHGRDLDAKNAVGQLLKNLDLKPLEFEEIAQLGGSANPYTGDIVSLAFKTVYAVVILLTPDDLAQLHEDFHLENDPEYEKILKGQARPNVLYETGMAMATHPDRTLIIEMGNLRPFSDVAGRNTIHFVPNSATLNAIAGRLRAAGCKVNTAGSAWLDTSSFEGLKALTRKPNHPQTITPDSQEVPVGTLLPKVVMPAAPQLVAKLHSSGNERILEISNRGGTALTEIYFDLDSDAGNWHIMRDALGEYPIALLEPRDHVRLPVVITTGSKPNVFIHLSAKDSEGNEFKTKSRISFYD